MSFQRARSHGGAALLGLLAGCTAGQPAATVVDDTGERLTGNASFEVRPGVEVVSVTGATPGMALTLYDGDGEPRLTQLADELGQTHFAYVPDQYARIESQDELVAYVASGTPVRAGRGYTVRADEVDPVETTAPFRVWAVDEGIDEELYGSQVLTGMQTSALDELTGERTGDPEDGFQYIEMRDGTLLSVMVRFPDPLLYGEGPWPTVVNYSGYSPSRPDSLDSGIQIATILGFATVGVNMRGSGCSGGVFDIFSPAQQADGYDVIETVARQDWALNGKVGMVGLSYPGITQLFVASTAPPSLGAITPLSVIADPWEMQWPGGIYNAGFTRQWVSQRDAEAAAGGASWVVNRIAEGDATCEHNVRLSAQNTDFELFFRSLARRPADADARDLNKLVEKIDAPVFLAGAFQDEQTGPLFASMLDRFGESPITRFTLYNGRHPDGYNPRLASRWFEFLEFYVADRIPRINPAIATLGAQTFSRSFGVDELVFEPDRFTDHPDLAAALAAYEAEPTVRVLYESGAGGTEPGSPIETFAQTFSTWPAEAATPRWWFLDADGVLADDPPVTEGIDTWRFDPDAGDTDFFGTHGYHLLSALWTTDWTTFAEGDVAAYVTAPFETPFILTGPGYADLQVKSGVEDVTVQVTLSEVRADGMETYIQSGWLRLGHRAYTQGEELRTVRTWDADSYEPVPLDTWTPARVAIPSIAHPMRAGSSLRLSISTPGRDHGTWKFENPTYAEPPLFQLARGGVQAASLTMATLDGSDIPAEAPDCAWLRGQPCRAYAPVTNIPLE